MITATSTNIPEQGQIVTVRRLSQNWWDGRPRFPKRRLAAIEVAHPDGERQVHAWLKEYAGLRQENTAGDVPVSTAM